VRGDESEEQIGILSDKLVTELERLVGSVSDALA
jgi:hypothetical protein